jgi:hypothetical protein
MVTREMIMQAIEELKEYGIAEPTAYEIRDMVNALYPVEVEAKDIILVMPDGSLPWSFSEL